MTEQLPQHFRTALKHMFRSRYNAVRRSAAAISQMTECSANDADGLLLADLRDEVEHITQAFHEANAYYNAMNAKAAPPPETET